MGNGKLLLSFVFLISLGLISSVFARTQHEGHDPGVSAPADERLPGTRRSEATCQKLASLAVELDREVDSLLDVSDPAELRLRLAEHRVKIQELRELTGECSRQCGSRPKRKGCGHRMRH